MTEERPQRFNIGAQRRVIGDQNRERVRQWFQEHLCGTARECAADLGLSAEAVGRHVRVIRAEWKTS